MVDPLGDAGLHFAQLVGGAHRHYSGAEVPLLQLSSGVYEVSLELGGLRLEAISRTRMRPGERAGLRLTGGWLLPEEGEFSPTESFRAEDAAATG